MEDIIKEYYRRYDELEEQYDVLGIENLVRIFNGEIQVNKADVGELDPIVDARNKIIDWNERVRTVLHIHEFLSSSIQGLPSPNQWLILFNEPG